MDFIGFKKLLLLSMKAHAFCLRHTNFINRLLSGERSKRILVIGLVAIGAGFTAII
tara:strand:+ start:530 stop:697 length:168 start_codon:yes stop_codon:yes gene_type:complete